MPAADYDCEVNTNHPLWMECLWLTIYPISSPMDLDECAGWELERRGDPEERSCGRPKLLHDGMMGSKTMKMCCSLQSPIFLPSSVLLILFYAFFLVADLTFLRLSSSGEEFVSV
jgi:hypothetical protein